MASKCAKDADNVYAPLVMVSIGGRKRTLASKTVYQNVSIDTIYDPLWRTGCCAGLSPSTVEVPNIHLISCLDSSLGAGGQRFAPRPWHVCLGALLEDRDDPSQVSLYHLCFHFHLKGQVHEMVFCVDSVDRKNLKCFFIRIIINWDIRTFMSLGLLWEYAKSLFASSPCTHRFFPRILRMHFNTSCVFGDDFVYRK